MTSLKEQTSSIHQQNQEQLIIDYHVWFSGHLSLGAAQIAEAEALIRQQEAEANAKAAAEVLRQRQSNGVHALASICYSNKNLLPAAVSSRTV